MGAARHPSGRRVLAAEQDAYFRLQVRLDLAAARGAKLYNALVDVKRRRGTRSVIHYPLERLRGAAVARGVFDRNDLQINLLPVRRRRDREGAVNPGARDSALGDLLEYGVIRGVLAN